MAIATMADLSSVGIMLDHIACTSGPLLFPRYGITLIIAVGGAFCPLNAEFHLRHSRRPPTRFYPPLCPVSLPPPPLRLEGRFVPGTPNFISVILGASVPVFHCPLAVCPTVPRRLALMCPI